MKCSVVSIESFLKRRHQAVLLVLFSWHRKDFVVDFNLHMLPSRVCKPNFESWQHRLQITIIARSFGWLVRVGCLLHLRLHVNCRVDGGWTRIVIKINFSEQGTVWIHSQIGCCNRVDISRDVLINQRIAGVASNTCILRHDDTKGTNPTARMVVHVSVEGKRSVDRKSKVEKNRHCECKRQVEIMRKSTAFFDRNLMLAYSSTCHLPSLQFRTSFSVLTHSWLALESLTHA